MGGQGNLVQRGIWIFVACCIVVAVWNTFPHDPKGFVGELQRKSEQLKGVATDVAGWVEGLVGGVSEASAGESGQSPAQKGGQKPVQKSAQ